MTSAKKNRLLLAICFLIYAISYIGKYSYSTNIQNVITDLHISKLHAGYVTSAFFFCYAAGQIINGILCERMNSKWTICIAMILSACITLVMYFLKNVFVMAVLWGINGLILSVLWCHCIKLLATIKDERYIARSALWMSVTVPAGLFLSYGLSALFTYLDCWKVSYITATIALSAGAVIFFFAVTMIQNGESSEEEEPTTVEPKAKETGESLFKVFGLAVLPLFFIGALTGLLRDGSSTFMPVLLTETYSMPDFFSILVTLGLPMMGVFSAFISNKIFQMTKSVMASALISGSASVLVMAISVLWFRSSAVLLIAMFMALSITTHILANALTSILPLYYKGKMKSGQAAGIVNAFIYSGSTISTLLLGGVVDNWGWTKFLIVLLLSAIVLSAMALLGLFLLRKKEK